MQPAPCHHCEMELTRLYLGSSSNNWKSSGSLATLVLDHVNDPEDIHQVVYHQRHRIIENLDGHEGLDDLIGGVPLYPLLRPGGSARLAGRHPAVSSSYNSRHRIPGHSGTRRAVRGLPGPCRVLSPWSVQRSGGRSRQEPCARSAARASATSAAGSRRLTAA